MTKTKRKQLVRELIETYSDGMELVDLIQYFENDVELRLKKLTDEELQYEYNEQTADRIGG